MYRRLLGFLRPHWWRMAGNIACNVIAAGLDVFSFTLLIPFLNALFNQPSLLPRSAGWITTLQNRTVGAFLDPQKPLASLGAMILAITDSRETFRHLRIVRAIEPWYLPELGDPEKTIVRAVGMLKEAGRIKEGDKLVIISDIQTGGGAQPRIESIQLRTVE